MVRRRPTTVALVAAALALLGGVALGLFAVWPRGGHGGAQAQAPACVQESRGIDLTATPGGGWAAGDGALSVPLGNGWSVWLFGDSFVRDADGSHRVVRNAMVLDSPFGIRTLGTDRPGSFFTVPGSGSEHRRWFWPAHGYAAGGRLWVVLSEMRSDGSHESLGDFHFVRSWLAEVETSTWSIRRLERLHVPRGIVWGAWILRSAGSLYVFGVQDRPAGKGAVLARVRGATLWSRWEPWTGPHGSARKPPAIVAHDVGAQFSVVPVTGGWALLTQVDVAPVVRLEVLRARSLTGPWGQRETLYAGTPVEGRLVYNVSAHPEYGSVSLLVSHCSVCANPEDFFGGPEPMRPGFLRVRSACLAVSPASSAASARR